MRDLKSLAIGLGCFAIGLVWIFSASASGNLKNDGDTAWWVTNNCPPGVAAPCLDNHVSLAQVPGWAK